MKTVSGMGRFPTTIKLKNDAEQNAQAGRGKKPPCPLLSPLGFPMMTKQEEEFIHFVSCIECLNRVWRLISTIKAAQRSPLVGFAFRFALVEYSKPYNASRGTVKDKHKLDTSCIPPDLLAVHTRIVNSRDQVHAHSDLTVMNAKLYISETQGKQRFTAIVQNIITGVEELPNIDEIQVLIEVVWVVRTGDRDL